MTTEELQQFVGKPESDIWLYLQNKGWIFFDCFSDYKTVFINNALNKSIVARLCAPYDEIDCVATMTIGSIWVMDGIYNEIPTGNITIEDLQKDIQSHIDRLMNTSTTSDNSGANDLKIKSKN